MMMAPSCVPTLPLFRRVHTAVLGLIIVLLAPSFLPTAHAQTAHPLFCPLAPSSLTQTLFLDPCLMSLNAQLSWAVAQGSTDLYQSVPAAAQYFPAHAPHLDVTKWTETLTRLAMSLKRKVHATNVYSVMYKNTSAPNANGDKHNFYSLAPYYWPNNYTANGLPYVLRDGLVNPESEMIGDNIAFNHLANDVYALSVGYYLLYQERYAVRAITLLNAWYVANDTMMYPNINHGQIRRGYMNDTGQATALIEFIKHIQIIDSIILLGRSTAYKNSPDFIKGVNSWFTAYCDWLLSNSLPLEDRKAKNNQHSFYNAQTAIIAAFLQRWNLVVELLNEVRSELVPTQFGSLGEQIFELERTNSWHYSNFNLQALCILSTLSQHLADMQIIDPVVYGDLPDLIGYNADVPVGPQSNKKLANGTGYGRSILGGLNYLMPYLPQTSNLAWNATHTQLFQVKYPEIVNPVRMFIQIAQNQYYDKPAWMNLTAFNYAWVADQLAPYYSAKIDWVLNGPDLFVINTPATPKDNNPSFALLISLFKSYFPFFLPVGIIGVYRWGSFLLRVTGAFIFFLTQSYNPQYIKCTKYSPQKDTTIIVPTIDYGDELRDGLWSWLSNYPKSIIFVTSHDVKPMLEALVNRIVKDFHAAEMEKWNALLEQNSGQVSEESIIEEEAADIEEENDADSIGQEEDAVSSSAASKPKSKPRKLTRAQQERQARARARRIAKGQERIPSAFTEVRILSIANPNKRKQMVAGLSAVKTPIVVFADDDAIWPKECLEQMTACFDNPAIGGVGTEQRMRPVNTERGAVFWEILADFRLTAKSIENAAACQYGESVTCLSGRTAAYRTCIFKPSSQEGPCNPCANNCFGSDEFGFRNEHYLPTSMLRKKQHQFEFDEHLPDDHMTPSEIRQLIKLHNLPANGGKGDAHVEEEEDEDESEEIYVVEDSLGGDSIGMGSLAKDFSSAPQRSSHSALTKSYGSNHVKSVRIAPTTPTKATDVKSSLLTSASSSSSSPTLRKRSHSMSFDDTAAIVTPSSCNLLYYQFCYGFLNDYFSLPYGKFHLHSGDDKFLTRWITQRGWQMYIQMGERACIYTTFKDNWMFIKQYMRWTRNTWRSDFRSLFKERAVWFSRNYWFLIFLMLDKMISPFTLLLGPALIAYLCSHSSTGLYATPHDKAHSYRLPMWNILISYAIWLMLSRFIRLFPHFLARPKHILYIPMFVAFQYILAPIKLYCLFTLHVVEWGTRKMNGDPLDEGQGAIVGAEEDKKALLASDDADVTIVAIPSDGAAGGVASNAIGPSSSPIASPSSSGSTFSEYQAMKD